MIFGNDSFEGNRVSLRESINGCGSYSINVRTNNYDFYQKLKRLLGEKVDNFVKEKKK